LQKLIYQKNRSSSNRIIFELILDGSKYRSNDNKQGIPPELPERQVGHIFIL